MKVSPGIQRPAAPHIRPLPRPALVAGAARPSLLAALLLGLLTALAATLALARPWQARVDVGQLPDRPFLQGFHAAEYSEEQQLSFRWSRPEARLRFPGAGPLAPLELRLHGDYQGMQLRLDAGSGEVPVTLRSGWQRVLLLPRPAPLSGDVGLLIRAPTQVNAQDPRERGVAVDWAALRGLGGAPPPAQAALLGLSAALAVLLISWSLRRLWPAVAAGLALAGGAGFVLAASEGAWRLLLTTFSGRLLATLLLGALLALASERLLAWLAARGVIRLGAGGRRALAAAALLAFLLRLGGSSYPLTYVIDLRFILGRARMVAEGRLLELFLPNPALTPVQWELDVTIPRSPFFYILTAPLTFLPGNLPTLALMAFSSLVDALAVLLLGVLVLQATGGRRAAVLAATLAAVTPLGIVLAVSWGVYTTLLAQCLVLLSFVLWLALRPRLHERRAQLALAGAFALAYLSYPTAMVFLGISWAILLALLFARRDSAARPTLWAGLAAVALAFLLYYGWHVPATLSSTLPALIEKAGGSAGGGGLDWGDLRSAVWGPLEQWYGPLLMILAGWGALLLALRRRADGRVPAAATLLLAWALTYPILAVADEEVATLILKHVLYILPPVMLLAALLLGQLAARRRGLIVAAALVALVAWQGIVTEIDLIIYASQRIK